MSDPQATLETYADQMATAAREHGQRVALGVEPHEWRAAAAAAIDRLAESGVEFSAVDVVRIAGPAPSPGAAGAALKVAQGRGRIFSCGVTRSTRPSRRGGLLLVWRGR